MGVPELQEYGSGQDVCGAQDVRLHRYAVLEPGTDAGDQGPGASLIVWDVKE